MAVSVKLVSVKKQIETKVKKSCKSLSGLGCKGCTLKDAPFVPVEDVAIPKFLVLSDAPGQEESNLKRPLVGKTTSLLREALGRLPYGYRAMHVVNCYPMTKEGLGRVPTAKEIEKCKEQLVASEVAKFDYVMLVGGVALNAVLAGSKTSSGELKISDFVGTVIMQPGKRFLPVYHPSYMYRMLNYPNLLDDAMHMPLAKEWMDDIFMMGDLIEGAKLPFGMQLVTKDNVREVRDFLKAQERIFLDVETSSLDVINCLLYSVSFAGMDGDIFHCNDGELMHVLVDGIKENSFVMHNAAFDYEVMVAHGYDLRKAEIIDTVLLANLLDANKLISHSFKLKILARIYLKYKYKRLILDMSRLSEFSAQELMEYNSEDVYVTRMLYKYFWDKLLSPAQVDFSSVVMSNAIKVISEIEMEGIQVDEIKVQEVVKECDTITEENGKAMKDRVLVFGEEFKTISFSSTKQLGDLISIGLEDRIYRQELSQKDIDLGLVKSLISNYFRLHRTPLCQLSVNQASLVHLGEVCTELQKKGSKRAGDLAEILRLLLQYRMYDKLRGTFLKNFVKFLSADKRVRARYFLTGTRTGRPSSSSPNLMNIPKSLRVVFIPKPGYKFIDADLSQIEIRIAATIADDPVLIEAYNKGLDVHKITAATVTGSHIDLITSEQRQGAKAVNFGFLYGMRSPSFKHYAKSVYGVIYTDEEAYLARQAYFVKYYGLAQWHKDTKEWVKRYGYVVSPFGRVYNFDMKKEDIDSVTRKGLNYPVQGTASDLNMYIMGEVFKWKVHNNIDMTFVGTVYDSQLIEVRDDLVPIVNDKIQEIVQSLGTVFPWLKVPIVIDVEIKDNWKERIED